MALFSSFCQVLLNSPTPNNNKIQMDSNADFVVIQMEDAEPFAAVAEPLAAVAEPLAAVAEPLAAVAEPLAAVAEPLAAVAEPLSAVAEPLATSTTRFGKTPSVVAELGNPPSVVAELGTFTPGMLKWLRQKAIELYANPPDSAFPTPFRITTGLSGCLRLTVYADTVENARQLVDDFMVNVKCYVAARETFAFVGHALAENIHNFFGSCDVRKLGPYIFTLAETDEGLFIQMTCQMVSLKDYQAAVVEFWNIYNFFLWLNAQPEHIHIQNALRQLSSDINHAVEKRNSTLKHQQKAPTHGPTQLTLADFLQPKIGKAKQS